MIVVSDILRTLNLKRTINAAKPHAVFTGFSLEHLEKVEEKLIKENEGTVKNIIVTISPEDLKAIKNFTKKFMNSSEAFLRFFMYKYLIYSILIEISKKIPLASDEQEYIKHFQPLMTAIYGENHQQFLESIRVFNELMKPNLSRLEENLDNFAGLDLHFWLDDLDFKDEITVSFQEALNLLLANKNAVHTHVYTSNLYLPTYSTYNDNYLDDDYCEFFESEDTEVKRAMAREAKVKAVATGYNYSNFAIREIDSHLPEDYFYPQDQLDQIYLRKAYPINPDLSYLNHSELLSELPARVLPVSEEILAIYGDASLEDLYELLQAEISNEKVISVPAKTILLGFNIFNKQLSKLERKQPLTGKIFMNQASFNQEMVNRSYDQFVEYLVSLLGNDPHYSFIPLRGLKRNGTMSDIRSTENLEKLLYLSEDRIKEILGIYYLPQKTADEALLKTAKKLIYSKNQIKSIFKHPSI